MLRVQILLSQLKIYYKTEVRWLLRMSVLNDNIGFIELVDRMGNDKSIVEAARVSFNNDKIEYEKNRDEKLISYLLKNKHSSPFEHVVFKFHVNAPLFVARQWMRHRTFSYNEISRRYTSENLEFYIPKYYRKQSADNKQASDGKVEENWSTVLDEKVRIHIEKSVSLYEEMIDKGVAREQSRIVLPQTMYTRFYVTGNLWNWLHFIDLRDHEHSQWEIRQYAKEIKILISNYNPITIDIWNKLKEE